MTNIDKHNVYCIVLIVLIGTGLISSQQHQKTDKGLTAPAIQINKNTFDSQENLEYGFY